MYAIAGSVEGKASLLLQDKVQCYNPHLNYWDFVGAMEEARAKAGAAEHEGLLYVSGKASRLKMTRIFSLLLSANTLRKEILAVGLRFDETVDPITCIMGKIRPHHLLLCRMSFFALVPICAQPESGESCSYRNACYAG